MNGTQAGWYRDPNTPGQLRYFDGATWTELGIPTFGLIYFVTWPICMAWAAIAANNANKASVPAVAVSAGAPPMAPQYAPQPQPYPQQAPMAPGPPPALPQSTGHDPFANGFEPTHELPQAQPPASGSWYR